MSEDTHRSALILIFVFGIFTINQAFDGIIDRKLTAASLWAIDGLFFIDKQVYELFTKYLF